jgi:hypothetical protein
LTGIRSDGRLANHINIDVIGETVPRDKCPGEQLVIGLHEELHNAPSALVEHVKLLVAKLPEGHGRFAHAGRFGSHTVYVYAVDVGFLNADPTTWFDASRPADGEWRVNSVEMRPISIFNQAAEDTSHNWRAVYLRGLVNVWVKQLAANAVPSRIVVLPRAPPADDESARTAVEPTHNVDAANRDDGAMRAIDFSSATPTNPYPRHLARPSRCSFHSMAGVMAWCAMRACGPVPWA